LDVARTADSSLVILVPESGDSIQTLKAGLMEIADVFAVNKADRPGADRLRTEIELMLGMRNSSASAGSNGSGSIARCLPWRAVRTTGRKCIAWWERGGWRRSAWTSPHSRAAGIPRCSPGSPTT
jgi:putative protein kinase ArgK-like GTPase of G3E family